MTKAEKERKEQLIKLMFEYINKMRHDLEEKGFYNDKYWLVFNMAEQYVETLSLPELECNYKIWKEYFEHEQN